MFFSVTKVAELLNIQIFVYLKFERKTNCKTHTTLFIEGNTFFRVQLLLLFNNFLFFKRVNAEGVLKQLQSFSQLLHIWAEFIVLFRQS